MKVLAVIPACEGSVVFPNKNMRIIRGKPLIYYAIRNAQRSRHITDVIVTSNSSEILSLGRQMGTLTRHRCEELCSPEVSLDAVVWDVFEQLPMDAYDCVVTMLPISPTLRVETLDAAFARFLAEDYDTVISVRNQAQFYWRTDGAGCVPMQPVRMNRHQLPPFYMETGAFLITKTACLSPESRLGSKVGLYELSGDEAVDVNNFGDLKLAENALLRKETAIFVNGNERIGLGHVARTLQIADELFTKPDFYYDRDQTAPACFGNTTYSLFPVDGEAGFLRAVAGKRYDVIINDVLDTSEAYMQELRAAAADAVIVNFEDSGPGAACADIVFNALYESGERPNVVTGSRYFIIPKLFLVCPPVPIRERAENVFVSFGGADPRNYSEALLRLASGSEYASLRFHVVLGAANRRAEALQRQYQKENITILHNIDNMAEVMSQCDVAVSARGRTCFELAALGIPTLSVAQHEREALHTFVCEEHGFFCLPPGASPEEMQGELDRLLALSRAERQAMQRKMLSFDLRSGRRNVVDRIFQFS